MAIIECLNHSNPDIKRYIDKLGIEETYRQYVLFNYNLPDFNDFLKYQRNPSMKHESLMKLLSTMLDLSQIPVKDLEEIKSMLPINTEGAFWRNAIYLGKNSTKHTAYEEAFHAIFQAIIPSNQKSDLLKVGRYLLQESLKGKSINQYLSEQRVKYPQLFINQTVDQQVDRLAEEFLANEFVEWNKNKGGYKNSASKKLEKYLGKNTASFIDKVIEFFNKLLPFANLYKNNRALAETFFAGIESGKYVNAKIKNENQDNSSPFTRLIEMPDGTKMSAAESNNLETSILSSLLDKIELEQDKSNKDTIDASIEKIMKGYSNWYQSKANQSTDLVIKNKNQDIASLLLPAYTVFNDETFEDELVVSKEYENIVADIKRLLTDVKSITDVIDDAEVQENEMAKYDEQANQKGYTAQSLWLRSYISTAGKVINTEEVEANPDAVKIIQSVDPAKVYYSLLRASRNSKSDTERIKTFINFAGLGSNEQNKIFLEEKLKKDIVDVDENRFSQDEWNSLFSSNGNMDMWNEKLHPKSKRLLAKIMKGFDMWIRENVQLGYDVAQSNGVAFNANTHGVDAIQVESWKKNYDLLAHEDNPNRLLPDATTATIEAIKEDFAVVDNMQDFNASVDSIQKGFSDLGINLSKEYIEFSLWSRQEAGGNKAMVESLSEKYDKFRNNVGENIIDIEFINQLQTVNGKTKEGLFTSNKTFSILKRIKKIANGNAIFDENALDTTYIDAEGNTIYLHQNKTFNLQFLSYFSDYNAKSIFEELANGSNVVQSLDKDGNPVTFTEDKSFFQNNFLIKWLRGDNYNNVSNFSSFSVEGIVPKSFSGEMTDEDKDYAKNNSVTFSSMKTRDFDLYRLNIFFTKYFKGKGTDFAPVFVGNNEAKNTAEFINMPVHKDLIDDDGKLSDRGKDVIYQEIRNEFVRIQRLHKEFKDGSNPNRFEKYNTGKTKEVTIRVLDGNFGPQEIVVNLPVALKKGKLEFTGDYRGMQFTNAVYGLSSFGMDLSSFTQASENEETKGIELILTQDDVDSNIMLIALGLKTNATGASIKQSIGTGVNAILDSQIEDLVNSKIISKKDGKVLSIPEKDGDSLLTSKANSLFVTELEVSLRKKIMSDMVNTLSLNQLMMGDPALSVKNDFVDLFKRNGGRNAAIVGFRNEFTDSSLGIHKPFKFVKSFIFKEPKSTADNDDAGHTSGDPASIDLADAQNWTSVDYFRKALWGQTKLTSFHARVLDDIESGKPIAKATMQRLLDSGIVFNSMKTVGFTGKVYHKKSDKMLTREETSIPEFISEEEYVQAIGNKDLAKGKFGVIDGTVLPDNADYTFYNDGDKKVFVKWIPKKEKAELHELRLRLAGFSTNENGAMQYNEVDEVDVAMPLSASKMTSANVYNGTGFLNVRNNNVSAMDANFYGLQTENPSGKEKIVDPTQMLEIIMSELRGLVGDINFDKVREEWDKLSEERDSLTFNIAYKDLLEQVEKGDISKFKEMILRGVVSSGGDIQTQQLLNPNKELDYNLNLPLVEGKFIQQFFAYFTKEILSQKVSGDSKVLVSSYGHNLVKKLVKTIVDGKEHISWEVINEQHPEYSSAQSANLSNLSSFRYDHKIDGKNVSQESEWFNEAKKLISEGNVYFIDSLRHNVPEISNGKIVGWFSESLMPTYDLDIDEINERYNKYFGVRIPSQDKQSAMNIKWVGMLPAYMGSSIVVPKEVVYLSGADFDVDKMYLQTTATYVNKDGDIVPYGSAKTEDEKFYEYKKSIKKNKIFSANYSSLKENSEEYARLKEEYNKNIEEINRLREELIKPFNIINGFNAEITKLYNKLSSKTDSKTLKTLFKSAKAYREEIVELENMLAAAHALSDEDSVESIKDKIKAVKKKLKTNVTKVANLSDKTEGNSEIFSDIKAMNEIKDDTYKSEINNRIARLNEIAKPFESLKKKLENEALIALGLPTQYESGIEKYTIGAINNRLLEIKQMALNNLKTLKENGISKTPITLTALTELKNEKEFLDTPKKYGSHWFGAHTNSHKQNTTGKGLIGVSVIFMLGYTNALKLGVRIKKGNLPQLDGKNLDPNSNVFHEFTTDKNGKQIRVMDVISTITSANTDEAKEQLNAYFGMTNETQAVVLQLVALGHSLKTALMFIKQPIITQYINRLQSLNYSLRKSNERKTAKNMEKDKNTALEETLGLIGYSMKDYKDGTKGHSYTSKELSDRLANGTILTKAQQLQILTDFNKLTDITNELNEFVGIIRVKKGLSPELSGFDKLQENITKTMYGDKNIINFAEQLNNPANEKISRQIFNYVKRGGIVDKIAGLADDLLLQRSNYFTSFTRDVLENMRLKKGEEDKVKKDVSSFIFSTLDGVSNDESALRLVYSGPNSLASKIQKLSLSDKSFSENPLIKKLILTFNKEGNQIPIDVVAIDTISKLTGKEQETLMDSFYSLYISSNPEHHQIAVDMFTYFKAKDGLQFGKDSLSKIFPASQFLDISDKLNSLMKNENSSVLTDNRNNFSDIYLTHNKNVQNLNSTGFNNKMSLINNPALKGMYILNENGEDVAVPEYLQSGGIIYKVISLVQGINLLVPTVPHGSQFTSSASSNYKIVSGSKAVELAYYINNSKNILSDNKALIEELIKDKLDNYAIEQAQDKIDSYYTRQKEITRAITKNRDLVTIDRFGDISNQKFVNGQIVVSKNVVYTFLDAVKKNGNNKPIEHSSQSNDKNAPSVVVNGQNEIITNEMLWMQNQFGFYDLINQETGEVVITNVDLGNGVQKVLDERLDNETPSGEIDLLNIGNNARKTGPLKTDAEVIASENTTSGGFKLSIDKSGKDKLKAEISTAYIFGSLGKGNNEAAYGKPFQSTGVAKGTSSTLTYAYDAFNQKIPVNPETSTSTDKIWVSVSGGNHALGQSKAKYDATISEIDKHLETGATFLMDSTSRIANNSYVQGPYSEDAVVKYLLSKGYTESPYGNGSVSEYSKLELSNKQEESNDSTQSIKVGSVIYSDYGFYKGSTFEVVKMYEGKIKRESRTSVRVYVRDVIELKDEKGVITKIYGNINDNIFYGTENAAGQPYSTASHVSFRLKEETNQSQIQDLESVVIPKTDLQQPNC